MKASPCAGDRSFACRADLVAWRRPVIVLLWLLAGAGAVLFLPGTFDNAFRSGVALLIGRPPGLTDVAMLLVPCAAAWTSLIYAARAN